MPNELVIQRCGRIHYDQALRTAGGAIGQVTSGTFGPWVGKSIGMGYVTRQSAKPGTGLGVEIRGKTAGAVVVKLPFYKRSG